MPNVYVVCGETGEYSDRQTWTTAAFLDETQAQSFCDKLNGWCAENRRLATARSYAENSIVGGDIVCPHDPNFQCYYTGTSYSVDTIPLRCE